MKQALLVMGTRPETIKMAPVYHALHADSAIKTRVCLTGQHREILDQMTEFFGIQADMDLDLMTPGQDLAGITSRILARMTKVLKDTAPDIILLQGDTTTVMATALAAFYCEIPVGHVEAGLRTWNLRNPFPEELNRWLADAISALHFAPTERSREALLRNGIAPDSIHVTGNTVIDALFYTLGKLEGQPFQALDLSTMKQTILLTTHRRESFGAPIRNTFKAVSALVRRFPDLHVIFPAHPNPNVQQAIADELALAPRVHVLPPQPYPEFVKALRDCHIILTDSGGVQEEAPSLGKPVLVLRETTERPEGVEAGTAKLIGTAPKRIEAEVARLLEEPAAYSAMANAINPYGDGHAAARIARITAEWLEA